jgi:hypothetical protein
LQYSGQAELRRLTLAHERQVGLKAAYARAKEAEIHPAAEGVGKGEQIRTAAYRHGAYRMLTRYTLHLRHL